jgi:Gly-Xaa carboxypeptidase
VIGVLEAFETLLKNGFKPTRTMLAGFGFDEEIRGPQGGAYIAKYLEESRGRNSIEFILDEGGLGFSEVGGVVFAQPGLGEKGINSFSLRIYGF